MSASDRPCLPYSRRLRKRATVLQLDESHVLVADKSGEVKRCAVHVHKEMQSASECTSCRYALSMQDDGELLLGHLSMLLAMVKPACRGQYSDVCIDVSLQRPYFPEAAIL